MKQFRIVDNVFGWLAFMIAAFVYCSTIEPTASFWDCPEFITTGTDLEVGHPPGAPFFMLTANLFSQFTDDPTQVARMVNTMSALLSAGCILFLFWTITHLVRRLLVNNWQELTTTKLIAIEAAGMVGALIYTFSDTFWFSAVEGEVYAYSSFFTAVVFWLILKWEDQADEPHSDRWLILIMYMTGLSIGVHLLNLLCLPAIVLVYYYRRFPRTTFWGFLVALGVSFVLLAAVLYGVVPGIITVGGWFELLFVNVLGMHFNMGLYVYLTLLVAAVIWAIYETQRANGTKQNWMRQNIAFLLAFALLGVPFYGYGLWAVIIGIIVLGVVATLLFMRNQKPLISARVKNTALLSMLMLMIGYSTYAVIVIRSSANPPMDQNSPEDIFTLGNYLSRDQYGYRPLVWGQAYNSEYVFDQKTGYVEREEGAPIYQKVEKKSPDEPDRYHIVGTKEKVKYAQNVLFPRMYSSDPRHKEFYERWQHIEGNEVPSTYRQGVKVKIPTFFENLQFFATYQCGFMYWRYFMWNFAGRQNDIQGNGEIEHGNWVSGISFIDTPRLGDQSKLPDDLKNNKGHNVFYCLPLLIGLIGLIWQLGFNRKKGVQQFWVVFFLFFMTGLAIVVYLNQTPYQPRERDYAYAGSFYAFAIWCGMGAAALISWLTAPLRKSKGGSIGMAAALTVLTLLIPVQMATQTWDDHDRSGRYVCRDFGQNYLMSLQQTNTDGQPSNPIIFTNGDNDTFPLWYNQDVESVRTDARVCNLSYLQTDWYIDQMIRPAYDSPSLPIDWKRIEYVTGENEYITVEPSLKHEILQFYEDSPAQATASFGDNPFELKNILKYWARSNVEELHCIPTDTVYITIDKEAVLRSGMLIQGDNLQSHEDSLNAIPDRMAISFTGVRGLDKSKLMMLEMLANANWERPVYVATTVGQENFMNLGEFFVNEGLTNRITPFRTSVTNDYGDLVPLPGMKQIDTEKMYDNLMNRYKFGGVKTKGIYLDETVMRMCYTHRRYLVDLAQALISEGQQTDDEGVKAEKYSKAAKVLEKIDTELPAENVPHDYMSRSIDEASCYAQLGMKEQAQLIFDQLWMKACQYMDFYLSLDEPKFKANLNGCRTQFYIMQRINSAAERFDKKLADSYYETFQGYATAYIGRGGNFQ